MKIGECFRERLESSIEGKLLNREEGIQAIRNLIEELNGVTNVNFNSGHFDETLSFTQLNLNQITEKTKNLLGMVMGMANYKEYDPNEGKRDWTHNPRYQVTRLLQFLLKTLEDKDSFEDFECTIKGLNKFMTKEEIALELVLTNAIEEGINIVFDVFFSEELQQKKSLEIMLLLILPERCSRKIASIIGEEK